MQKHLPDRVLSFVMVRLLPGSSQYLGWKIVQVLKIEILQVSPFDCYNANPSGQVTFHSGHKITSVSKKQLLYNLLSYSDSVVSQILSSR